MSLALSFTGFGDGEDMPSIFTGDDDNGSPPLAWTGVTPGAKSLALIVEGPDAPEPAAPQRI